VGEVAVADLQEMVLQEIHAATHPGAKLERGEVAAAAAQELLLSALAAEEDDEDDDDGDAVDAT
jgi:hypothetical protein